MGAFFSTLTNSVSYLTTIGIADAFDILIVAILIFAFIQLIRNTKSMRVAKGVVILLLLLWLSGVLRLSMINFLLRKAVELGVIALVILFQPELRRMLERLGNTRGAQNFLRRFGFGSEVQPEAMDDVIRETARACADMGAVKTGALIVFPRENRLEDIVRTGTLVNADVSAELLKNLFFKNSPLHDGAVVIRDGRVTAAGCILPMKQDLKVSKELGTRHRAGISESGDSDAVVVIVSEETGSISVAVDGELTRHLNGEKLAARLK